MQLGKWLLLKYTGLLKELRINPNYVVAAMVFYISLWAMAAYGHSYTGERAAQTASALQVLEQQIVSEQAVLESQAYTLLTDLPGEMWAEALQQIVLNNSSSYALQVIRLETLKGDTSSVVVELRGDLKEYLLFTDDLRRQYPSLQIKPQTLSRKNGQLQIVCILTA